MKEQAAGLIRSQDLCALATCGQGRPEASLMQYAAGEGGTRLYMLSLRDSRKAQDIAENRQVSVLIDTRGRRGPVAALTLHGTAALLPRERWDGGMLAQLLRVNADLKGLAEDGRCVMIRVDIEASQLVLRADEAGRQETRGQEA